jgi:predicted phosphoribosyltransferase/predicted alpha/beta-hydrolase family hydrolase
MAHRLAGPFRDRRDGGRCLAEGLWRRGIRPDVVVGLTRGGVPVAAEVARRLRAGLEFVIVRKVGAPLNPEFAIGAVAEEGVRVRSDEVVGALGIEETDLRRMEAEAAARLDEQRRRFREGWPPVPLAGRSVVLVDDGLATGTTVRAAIRVVRRRGAARVVVAAPLATPDAVERVRREADDVVCVDVPAWIGSVGEWYEDFSQVSEEQVRAALGSAGRPPASEEVTIGSGAVELPGSLMAPPDPVGLVIFAHGSGSSRLSPRNAFVASRLNDAGLATLLFDLLTDREAEIRGNVFDVGLLASRLHGAFAWVGSRVGPLPVGFFGASTGAAAALVAAADLGDRVAAVVSRGGRPDLAAARLPEVTAPTLLIVGGEDHAVEAMNREAIALLRSEARLELVPGATHLFEEPGTLERVADLAASWLFGHLRAAGRGRRSVAIGGLGGTAPSG